MIGPCGGAGEVLEASQVAAAYVGFGNVVSAGEDPIADASEVEFDIFCCDVDQHNLKAACPRVDHHSQVSLAGKRRFDREALALMNVCVGSEENVASRCDCRCSRDGWRECLANRGGIEQRKVVHETGAARERGFAAAIGARNDSKARDHRAFV